VKLVDTSSWVEYLRESESDVGARVEELVLAGQESDAVDRLLVPLVAPQFLAAVVTIVRHTHASLTRILRRAYTSSRISTYGHHRHLAS